MINSIRKYLPKGVEKGTFYDIFGGGFNVGVNMSNSQIVFNDINRFVVDLVKSFKKYDTYEYIKFVKRTIKKFQILILTIQSECDGLTIKCLKN